MFIKLTVTLEKYDLSEEVFGELISDTKKQITELLPNKDDIVDIKSMISDKFNSVFASGLDFIGGFKEVVRNSMQDMLKSVKRPREIDYIDVEYFLSEIKDHLESLGLDFQDFDDEDSFGNKNDFHKYFMRDVIREAVDTYLSSFGLTGEKKIDTGVRLKKKLNNILDEPILEEMLVSLTEQGLIKLSDNLGNKFTKEIEQKILEVDREDLVSKLDDMSGVRKTFEGQVTDEYYDFLDNRLALGEFKSSFRIRKKENIDGTIKYYYTAKRKDTDAINLHGYRDCWEEEYEILEKDYNKIQSMVTNFGLYKSREKTKYRTSYAHDKDHIKFDIDEYKGIPTVLEIEGESGENIEKYKEILGVNIPDRKPGSKKHMVSSKGSSWLHKVYGVYYKRFKPDGTIIEDDKNME